MAFTVTSNSCTVVDNGTYFELTYSKVNKQHNSLVFYLDYSVQGDETQFSIKTKRKDARLNSRYGIDNYYYETIDDGNGNISVYEQIISDTEKMAVIWQVSKSEESIVVEITPDATTGDGVLSFEITENNYST